MRVLLTGAAGFLGSHALRHLMMTTDWHVVCPVSFRHKGVPERIVSALDSPDQDERHGWCLRTEVVRCDLAAPIHHTTAAKFGQIDVIVNYAANSHVDRSIADPVPFFENNVAAMLHLLEYARSQPLQAFVQVSTDEVYGPAPDGYAHREWDAIIPSNPYSASKAAAEAAAIAWWRTFNIPMVIVNCMNLIGEMQDPEKFVPMTMAKVLAGETVIVHADHEGRVGSRFYLHARNLADAIVFLLRRGRVARCGEADRPDRWHIVGEREISNLEMAHLVADMLCRPLKYELADFHGSRPGHDLRYALNGTKITEEGWTPPLGLEVSLKKAIDWTLAHPVWSKRSAP